MKQKVLYLTLVLVLLFGFAPRLTTQAATSDNTIQLTQAGTVTVTVATDISNTCGGKFGLSSPNNKLIFEEYNAEKGQTATVGYFPAGTPLVFYIQPGVPCGKTYLSTDPARAIITPLAVPNSWRIGWEDGPGLHPDNDFNDLIIIVRLKETAVPDYKQNDPLWENNAYDGVQVATIGGLGSQLTAATNILNFYNNKAVTPPMLNDCLSNSAVGGYNAGAVRWSKVGSCSDPASPATGPYSVSFVQELHVGDWITQTNTVSGTVETVQVTKDLLKQYVHDDLGNYLPVILEVQDLQLPTGVHYVVATTDMTTTYTINDPWCVTWSGNNCTSSKTSLADYNDALEGIVRFEPGNNFHKILVIDATPNVQFVVTNPEGKKTGYSVSENLHFANIPNANYFFQPPQVNNLTNQANGSGDQEFYVIDPLPTGVDFVEYVIYVQGTGSGQFDLTANYHSAPLTSVSLKQSGSAGADARNTYYLRIYKDGTAAWVYRTIYLPFLKK